MQMWVSLALNLRLEPKPAEGFDITAGLGFIDAAFNWYTNPFTGKTFNGNNLPYAPNLTYNLAAQYRHPIGLLGRIELQGFGKPILTTPIRLTRSIYLSQCSFGI